jgi:hypothetical protein
MTRLWPEGSPITVFTVGSEVPQHFTWQGQKHNVKEITRRWRVDLDWWRENVWRDYFKLTTQTGLLVVIFHDLQADQWYLQRLYD